MANSPRRPARPPAWGFISRSALEDLLSENLSPIWLKTAPPKIYLGDSKYYVPPKNEALDIIRRSRPLFRDWADEIFDCDDFAFVLKGHFCRSAFRHGPRRFAYCFGIVWKNKPKPHAMNWIVYRAYDPKTRSGGKLTFALVEPQWFTNPTLERIRPLAPTDGDVYFVVL